MNRIQYWIAVAVGLACLVLMAANVTLVQLNQSARADVGQRQQYVQQSVQLEGLYREIIRSLADLAARNNDGDVKALLQRHGISFNVSAAPAQTAAPVAPVAQARK